MTTGRRILTAGIASSCALLALSLLLPFILHQNAWYEWGNAYWLLQRQADSMSDLGHPSYFLHTTETGVFYPQFAFYGGSLFAAAGAIALLLGSAWAAFVGVLVVAAACAYGGVLSIGRQAGLGWVPASLAALTLASSPYSVTALYGRGAWTEILATSAVPLALAGGLAVMTAGRPWAGVAALVAAAALVGGSHNVTVVWGSLFCGAVALVVVWARAGGGDRAYASPSAARRAALGLGAIAVGAALVAWSLLPSAVYGRQTRAYDDGASLLDRLAAFDALDVILRPYPFVPGSLEADNPAAKFQLPVYVLAWALAAIGAVLLARRGGRSDRRLAVGLAALLVVLVAMLVVNPIWDHLPPILTAIQFPIRLHAYAVILVALLVVAALRLLRDAPRRQAWLGALVVALTVQVAFAQASAWRAPGALTRDQVVADVLPPAFAGYQRTMYRSVEGSEIPRPPTFLLFDPARIHDDTARQAPPSAVPPPFATNVIASSLVRIRAPWRGVGRDFEGLEVITAPAVGAAAEVVAEPASPWAVTLAGVLSMAAVVVICGGGAWLAATAWRRRRAAG